MWRTTAPPSGSAGPISSPKPYAAAPTPAPSARCARRHTVPTIPAASRNGIGSSVTPKVEAARGVLGQALEGGEDDGAELAEGVDGGDAGGGGGLQGLG
jgi:hypothetical protein